MNKGKNLFIYLFIFRCGILSCLLIYYIVFPPQTGPHLIFWGISVLEGVNIKTLNLASFFFFFFFFFKKKRRNKSKRQCCEICGIKKQNKCVCVSRLMMPRGGGEATKATARLNLFLFYILFRYIKKGLFYITMKPSTQSLESMAHELSAVCVVDSVFHIG